MATGAKRKGSKASAGRRGAVMRWLRRLGAALLLLLLAAGIALWWAARWAPPRDQYPWQGATIDAGNGDVQWGSVKAAGADFAYIVATEGAAGADTMFPRNPRGARGAGRAAGGVEAPDPRRGEGRRLPPPGPRCRAVPRPGRYPAGVTDRRPGRMRTPHPPPTHPPGRHHPAYAADLRFRCT